MSSALLLTPTDIERALAGRTLLVDNPNGFTHQELADDLINSLDLNSVEAVLKETMGSLDSAYREVLRQLSAKGVVDAEPLN